MENMPDVMQTVFDPLQTLIRAAVSKAPSLLGALLLLLLGSFIARWLSHWIDRLLTMTKLDENIDKIGVNEVLHKLGLGRSVTALMGFLVYWLIFLAFLLSAANVMQLTVVSEFLEQIVLFLPKMIAAVLVLGGGLFLGHFASEVVERSAQANKIKGAGMLAQATYGIVIVFSAIMALQRLGIDTSVVSQSMQIVIGSIGLGCAIAFGIAFGNAGKDAAKDWIDQLTRRKV